MIRAFMGTMPTIADSAFVAESAVIIGDVVIGQDSSIWYGTTIRGDVHYIRIGAGTNIQDQCVLHVDHGKNPVVIGNEVTVGHGAIIHGCTIKDGTLIGMGAIILSGALIREECIIGAGALVTEGTVIPPRSLVIGVPAKVKRPLTEGEVEELHRSARDYVKLSRHYLGTT
jgi:gamma-carbonic anhydrase